MILKKIILGLVPLLIIFIIFMFNLISSTPVYHYELFEIKDCGVGYRIYENKKLIIQQSSVPAIKGNKCIKTHKEAMRIANLVISKIKHQQNPTVKAYEIE